MWWVYRHVKKKSANPKKSTANSKAHPSARVLALANMSSDPRLINVGNFSGMEDPNVAAKKKPIHIAWRLEIKKQQGIFHKEVKESVATSHTHLTRIPIDAKREIVGLRIMLQQAIKDASYAHLDLTIK